MSEPVFFNTAFAADLSLDEIGDEPDDAQLDARMDEEDFIRRNVVFLTPREERVIRLRFGLGGIGMHTLQEVGDMMGLERSGVGAIEARALRKLRYRARRLWPERAVRSWVASHASSQTRSEKPKRQEPKAKVANQSRSRILPAGKRNSSPKGAGEVRRGRVNIGWKLQQAMTVRQPKPKRAAFPGVRGLCRFVIVVAAASLTLASAWVWSLTLGVEGKELFTTCFGEAQGPHIRLFTWLFTMTATPACGAFARFAFEDWIDQNYEVRDSDQ